MKFAPSYLQSAVNIINQYDGSEPLQHHLKKYFAEHKKHGSKDRKYITSLCYTFYRLGDALNNLSIEERIKVSIFLCNSNATPWQALYNEEWLSAWSEVLTERISFVRTKYSFTATSIFPFIEELSAGIQPETFALSHLTQPDLFLRARPGKNKAVQQKLEQHNIPFTVIGEHTLALTNASKIDTILAIDKEVVVQDYSSQRVGAFMSLVEKKQPTVWDCCAASGGKSILAIDVLTKIKLTVSDIRQSIIHNLKQRFGRAGINLYNAFVADIGQPVTSIDQQFDLIICDAPCSGSGTWGRTPEQLQFFTKDKINYYASLQKKIAANTIPHLAKDGYFLYITCSVYKKENEEAVAFILKQFPELQLVKQELLLGYEQKADSMFAAMFKKI